MGFFPVVYPCRALGYMSFHRLQYPRLRRLAVSDCSQDRAEKLLGTDLEKRRKGPNDAARRIKTTHVRKDAEAAENSRNEIDRERVGKEERFHGFYAVATSLDRPTQEILAVNKQRWKIEQSFRIRKTEFSSRPVYVSTEEHIRAHFAIC